MSLDIYAQQDDFQSYFNDDAESVKKSFMSERVMKPVKNSFCIILMVIKHI